MLMLGKAPASLLRAVVPLLVVACSGAPTLQRDDEVIDAPPPNKQRPTPPPKTEGAPAATPPAPQSDQAKRCRIDDAFGPLARLDTLRTLEPEAHVSLTADELTIVFERGSDTSASIWSARRARLDQPFGTPVQEVPAPSFSPSISADGTTLYFTRAVGSTYDIFRASRASVTSRFGLADPVTAVNTSSSSELMPFVRGDELWFSTDRTGGYDLYRAPRVGEGFAAPFLVAELATPDYDFGSVLTDDGLAIYFTRRVRTLVGETAYEAYVATRASKTDRFSEPRTVPELMQPGTVTTPTWISPDNCRLYVTSDRAGAPGEFDPYVASRMPPP
jgi:hypothetical protein